MASPGLTPDLAREIVATAGRLGINPLDLGTAISYETGGRFSPSMFGGAGGRHMGLIQFGPSERAKYGANADQSAVEQMGAVERYLLDRGLKPGMGMMDLYSTINAGRPGLYDRSDAANGGAPGTVADKVNNQMGVHRERVSALLGNMAPETVGKLGSVVAAAPAAPAAPAAAPASAPAASVPLPLVPGAAVAAVADPAASPLSGDAGMALAQQYAAAMKQKQAEFLPLTDMRVPGPINPAQSRAIAEAILRSAKGVA